MFYYSGTKDPIRLNDWVSWYADPDARGYILTLDTSINFSIFWDDVKVKLYPCDYLEFLRKLE